MSKSKQIIKFMIAWLLFFPIGAFLIPFLDLDLHTINNELFTLQYWIEMGIICIVSLPIIIYFKYLNPRSLYTIDCSSSIVMVVLLALIIPVDIFLILPLAVICEVLFIKICLVVLFFLLFLATIYLALHGVYVYRKKDILIYNNKFKYYKNAIINDIKVEEYEKYNIINIVINNQDNIFKVNFKKTNKYIDKIKKIQLDMFQK